MIVWPFCQFCVSLVFFGGVLWDENLLASVVLTSLGAGWLGIITAAMRKRHV